MAVMEVLLRKYTYDDMPRRAWGVHVLSHMTEAERRENPFCGSYLELISEIRNLRTRSEQYHYAKRRNMRVKSKWFDCTKVHFPISDGNHWEAQWRVAASHLQVYSLLS